MTHEVEDELVDWFEGIPIFFDQRMGEFKDWGKRDKLFCDKGIDL